jgi:hypothetical protein
MLGLGLLLHLFYILIIYVLIYLDHIHCGLQVSLESLHEMTERHARAGFPSAEGATYLIVEPTHVLLLLIGCLVINLVLIRAPILLGFR